MVSSQYLERRDPMSAIREVMYGNLTRLRNVYRYSGEWVLHRENVAEHSFWTALIAITIAHEHFDLNTTREVAVRALLHDIEESMTGDLVRSMKYYDEALREDIKRVEEAFAATLLNPLGATGHDFYDIWLHSKDDSLAGRIVALADLLCVISYCDNEEASGNHKLREIRKACTSLIEDKFADDPELKSVYMEALLWPRN